MFDLGRLRAQTKTVERLIVEALFADDCALLAHFAADLQAIVNKFAEATHLLGLTISIKKTEVLHQPSPQRLPPPSTVNQQILAAIKFGVSQNKVIWRLLNLATPPSMQCTINVIYVCWRDKY